MALNTVINTNMMALTAHRNLGAVGNRQAKSNQRLSSGKKINSAADDAAGLAISEKMKAQIKGLDMAAKNSEDAISLIQTAEGSLTEVNNMLNRMRELSVQAANDTNQQEDRVKIAQEVAELMSEIDSISERTEFNEKKLNDGSFQDGHFQIGANGGQSLNLNIGRMDVEGLGLDKLMDTFGIEGGNADGANLKATIIKTDGTTNRGTNRPATTHKVKEIEFDDLVQDKTATATITYKDADGNLKSITGKEFTTSAGNKDKAGQLIADSFIGMDLDFTIAKNGNGDKKLDITSNKEGSEGRFEIVSVSVNYTDNTASSLAKNLGSVQQEGYDEHDSFATTDLVAGSSLTVGGKTITIVDSKNDITDPKTQIVKNDKSAFQDLLAKEGIKVVKSEAAGNEVKFVKIKKGYLVSDDKVSDTGSEFSDSLKVIDNALKNVTQQRAKLGANQNRLEYTIKNLELSSENLNAARSRIEDTDMAKEMMNLTQANVLQQAATSILAQANQAPQSITQLLG